jgi:hypothetical protein
MERNGNAASRTALTLKMPLSATETVGLRTLRVRKRSRGRVRFYALDTTLCVLIEADSEEDAHYLCQDARLEFIALCEK